MSNWLKASIMYTTGVAKGKTGTTHELTEAKQGRYHYTMGPYSEPVLQIKPGDRVVVETRDAFEGAIKTEQDLPTKKLRMPFLNPQNGPIMIEGAEKGDALAVYIESMVPRGTNPLGTCCMIPEFGALTGTYYTATLNDPLPEVVRKINVDEQWVYWSDRVTLPYKPHIGTLSCSPEIDSINSLTPGQSRRQHGPARHGPRQHHVSAGALPGRPPVHRRRARLPGRRRGVRRRRRVSDRHHDSRRPDQGLDHRVAAPRERGGHHDDRQRPAAGGRDPDRLSRARAAGWRRNTASTNGTPT